MREKRGMRKHILWEGRDCNSRKDDGGSRNWIRNGGFLLQKVFEVFISAGK